MSNQQIHPVPKLPSEIKEAVDRQKLVVFIGAGVSRIIGCAPWYKLAEKLASVCYDNGHVGFKEREALAQYSRSGDHKKTISICKHILNRHHDAKAFYEELERALEANKQRLERFPIYEELYRFRALFVTTNMDTHFDQMFTERSIAYRSVHFAFDADRGVDHTRLYHLHGTITDSESLVLTVADYFRRYQDENVVSFLKHLFSTYRVLFVGYGLSEFEILDFVINRYSAREPRELRHFYLMPLYAGEENILEFEQSYLGDLGINVLPFRKDERGYDQLFEVIREWQREINLVSSYLYDSLPRVEEHAAAYAPHHEEELFQLIRNDPPLEDHFLKKVSSSDWLIPLLNRDYFAPHRNPSPVESEENPGYYRIPYWNVLEYLERVAAQVSGGPDDIVASTVMGIVRSVSDHRDETGRRIDNYHTDRALVKVMSAVPVPFLERDDMDRVGLYLRSRWRASDLVGAEIGKSLLPKLLRDQASDLAARLLNTVLAYDVHERNGAKEVSSVMNDFWLNDVLERNKSGIQRLFPLKAAKIVLDKIEEIVSEDRSRFNVIWIPAVEDHPQNRFPNRYQNILVRAARDFLDAAAQEHPQETRCLVQELLAKEHPIFPRIALNCISKHWLDYCELFWPLLESPLSTDVSVKHELYELLKRNHASLSEEQTERILHWIETREYWTPSDGFADDEYERRTRGAQKLEWLTALKDSLHERPRQKYDKYLALAGQQSEHPGFSTWMGDVQVGSISPLEVSELLQQENADIARYLAEYRDEGEWYGKPSREGLADAFKAAVSQEPQKFAGDLSPFLDLPPYYLYYLLWGFNDAWTAKRDFEWEALLSFCVKLAETAEFWAGPPKEDPEYPGSLVSQVADLIDGGTRDDSHAFDESLLPRAEELLMLLLAKAPSEMYEEYDLLTAVINSPKGKVLRAAVSYSVRCGRLRKEEDPTLRWCSPIREDFTRRLDRSFDATPEFSAAAGEYLAKLYWLDQDWVVTHVNEILPKEDDKHWEAAMTGYLWTGPLYRELYKLLRENGHYEKALRTTFAQGHTRERLIQHLTIAYLWGDEELANSESLFHRLIDGWAPSDLNEIVTYLWMQRDGLEPKQRHTVLALWRHLHDHYDRRDELPDEEKRLVADLSRLAVYLDSLGSEAVDWLRLSISHFRTEQDAWFLIEYLHQLVDANPEQVASVYLEILRQGLYPTFGKEDHIIPIVDTLYEKGEKDSADRICNLYGAERHDFLRPVYDRHQPSE